MFPIGVLLARLCGEFRHLATSQRPDLRVMPCSRAVRSDPRLLEQMLRNLLSNASKYTMKGRILPGCRRRAGLLRIEVCDTGVGIPAKHHATIFDEYQQLDDAARQRDRGLGLGLSIVRRLATLLGHGLQVRSMPGRGSIFAVEVPLDSPVNDIVQPPMDVARHRTGVVLVVEDDPEVRDLLVRVPTGEGHRSVTATDGEAALELVDRDALRPDIVLADYNLPNGMDGLHLGARLRERLGAAVPVVILTADISTGTSSEIARLGYLRLHKPVRAADLAATVQSVLADAHSTPEQPEAPVAEGVVTIHVVDDDVLVHSTLARASAKDGRAVRTHDSGEACLLVDAQLPGGISGFDLLKGLRTAGDSLPVIMITGFGDVAAAVCAMKSAAFDFIEKPVRAPALLAAIDRAMEQSRDRCKLQAWHEAASAGIA